MSLTPKQIILVQDSWSRKVRTISVQAAELFYGRLFELDPTLKALFAGDLAQQGVKLMNMLGTVIVSLRKLDTVIPDIQQLGQRHRQYGVKDEHYATVGSALLWTLNKGLGEEFTPELREAWTAVYATLSGVMLEATQEESRESVA